MRESELVTFLSWLRQQPGVALGDLNYWKAAREFRAFLEAYDCDPSERIPSQPRDDSLREEHKRAGAAGITYDVPQEAVCPQ